MTYDYRALAAYVSAELNDEDAPDREQIWEVARALERAALLEEFWAACQVCAPVFCSCSEYRTGVDPCRCGAERVNDLDARLSSPSEKGGAK